MATPANNFSLDLLFSGNKHMHGNMNELEFLPDPTPEFGTICP